MDQERRTCIVKLKLSLAAGKTLQAVSLGGDPGDSHPDFPTVVWRIHQTKARLPAFALIGRDRRGIEHILFEQASPSLEVLFSKFLRCNLGESEFLLMAREPDFTRFEERVERLGIWYSGI